jgi:hypothetical protein
MTAPPGRVEAFREYLETSGLSDSISRVLASLYDAFDRGQQPANPLDYLKSRLGVPEGFNADNLKANNDTLRRRVEQLKQQLRA